MRVGFGYDVHRLVEERDLILGGVKIPYEKGLLGHSDADVLVHAVMDALLGAAALGDIGRPVSYTHLPLAGAEVYAKTEEKDRAKESIRTILKMRKKLYRMCGLPTHLREAGVKPEQFEAVARAAVNDGAMIVNPKAAGIEDVLKILAEAY